MNEEKTIEAARKLECAISALHTTILAYNLNKRNPTCDEITLLQCNISQLSDMLCVVDNYMLDAKNLLQSR